MSLGRRLINTGGVEDCTTDTADVFGDSNGVALYNLDYDASDASGNYDGTPSNVTFGVGGQINYGARFNGSSSYIDLGASLLNSRSAFSVSAWVNFDNLNTQNFIFFNSESGTGNEIGFYDFGNGNIYFQPDASTSANRGYVSNSGIYTTSEWVHIVMVFDGSATGNSNRLKAYIQGQPRTLTYEGTIPSSSGTSTCNSWIGGRSSTKFSGDIDQVRVFSKALSSDEVEDLFEEEACVHTATTTDNYFPLADGSSDAVAYYKLDNSSLDFVGSNDGTDTNIEYRFGRFGQAAVFNGSSSRVNISSLSLFDRSSFAISCWVKSTNVTSTGRIISHEDSGGSAIIIRGDDVVIDARDAGASASTTLTMSTTNNQWHHVCLVNDSNHYYLYLDGVEVDDDNYGYNPTSATAGSGHQLAFGYRKINNDSYWSGDLDQVRVFSTALTSAQVSQLYNEKPETDTSNFKTVLWDMDGVDGRYISNVGFQPDFVWIKDREDTSVHVLFDSIRGATNYLSSSSTAAEASASTTLQSFEANGFFLGNSGAVNDSSGNEAVAWVWKGGGDAVTDSTTGDLTADISANTEAGFSIVNFTGVTATPNGVTVPHGLNSAPELVILKTVSVSGDWQVYAYPVGNNKHLKLNDDAAAATTTGWDNTHPDSNNVTMEWSSISKEYIMYCWHSVSGYSKIGSYAGGTNGIQLSTGFTASWVMIKRISGGTGHWYIYDNVRGGDSEVALYANLNNIESSASEFIQFNDTNIQINSTGTGVNGSSSNYIYMAFK
jgi:hypothetical protein